MVPKSTATDPGPIGRSGPTIPAEQRYGVVVCTRCRHAKGIDRTARTTTCGRCSAKHETAKLRLFYATGDPVVLQDAVGVVEAKVTGGDVALVDVDALRAEIEARNPGGAARKGPADDAEPEDLVQYAASLVATVVSKPKKADGIVEALDDALPEGVPVELVERAFVAAGLPFERAEKELRRMLVQDELYEPRPGFVKRL